jgi:hypothetical protein
MFQPTFAVGADLNALQAIAHNRARIASLHSRALCHLAVICTATATSLWLRCAGNHHLTLLVLAAIEHFTHHSIFDALHCTTQHQERSRAGHLQQDGSHLEGQQGCERLGVCAGS